MNLWKHPSIIRIAASRALFFSLFLLLSLSLASTASAQKKKKKNDATPNPPPAAILPDEQRIDNAIGEMLAAWQLSDIEKPNSHNAADVDIDNGMMSPPA